MQSYDYIQSELAELGIYTLQEFMFRVVFSSTVSDDTLIKLDTIMRHDWVNISNSISKARGQFIAVEHTQKEYSENINKYLCLFPSRSLITTVTDSEEIKPDEYAGVGQINDYFIAYFTYKRLIDAGVSRLFPTRIVGTYNEQDKYIKIPNVAQVFTGKGDASMLAQNMESFYIAFPWLYHAQVDDYLEIADQNPREFEAFAIAVERLAISSKELNSALLYDMKEAIHNIQVQYEKRCRRLRAKGIAAATGLALTIIPIVIKEFFLDCDISHFSSIIGGSTVVGNINLLSDFISSSKDINDDPYWVLWKWWDKSQRK